MIDRRRVRICRGSSEGKTAVSNINNQGVYIVKADEVITGRLSPLISSVRGFGRGLSSAGATVDSYACWATSRARVRVAIESEIRLLNGGRDDCRGIEFEKVCDRRSSNRTGRRA
jgi:hypothetical protein